MGSKVIRNITKVFRSASGVLFGRSTAGTGHGEELTPSQVRSLLSVYTVTQTDTAISTAVNALIGGSTGLLDTLDELAAALGDDANFAATMTTALAGKVDSSSLSESIDDRVAALLVAGTNITLTYNDASGTLTVASSGGVTGSTGSVDNAVLAADGTGGSTLQARNIVIHDVLTSSPNNTVNHVCLEATGGTTNVSISVKPKGTGAFCMTAPDGTSAGGNVRGANAVDLQILRAAASYVASGDQSFAAGSNCTASGGSSVAIGNQCSATANYNIAMGRNCTAAATGNVSGVAMGYNCSIGSVAYAGVAFGSDVAVMGEYSVGTGLESSTTRSGQRSHANGKFAVVGDAQMVEFPLRITTTNATPTTMMLNGASTRLTIPSGKKLTAIVIVSGIKSDGSACAEYVRKVSIKNVSGTTSLVGSVETIGTDIEDNASTDVTITADNTNDALQINVTGITGETWRWMAVVEGLEVAYGT